MDGREIFGLILLAIGVFSALFNNSSRKIMKIGGTIIAIVVALMIMFEFVAEFVSALIFGICIAAIPISIIVMPIILIDIRTKFLSKHNKNLPIFICIPLCILFVLIATIWLLMR